MFELLMFVFVCAGIVMTGFTLLGSVAVVFVALLVIFFVGALGLVVKLAPWLILAAVVYWLWGRSRRVSHK